MSSISGPYVVKFLAILNCLYTKQEWGIGSLLTAQAVFVLEVLVIRKQVAPDPGLEQVLRSSLRGVDINFSYSQFPGDLRSETVPNLVILPFDKSVENKTGALSSLAERYSPAEVLAILSEAEMSIELCEDLRKAGAGEVMTLNQMSTSLGKRLLDRMAGLTAQAKAEYQVEKTEALFRGIIEHASDMVTLLAADGTIIYESPSFERQLGYAAWEVLGQDAFDFVHPDDVSRAKKIFENLVAENFEASPVVELRFRHKDGSWRTLAAVANNQLKNEAVQAIVVNSRDISKQKETEQELERYRLHLEELVEQRTREVEEITRRADAVLAASPDALIAISNEGKITFVSDHWRKAYPKNAHKLVPGTTIEETFEFLSEESGIPADDPRYKEMKPWWRNPVGQKEFRLNNDIWLRVLAKKMPDGNGVVVTTTNITDYKQQQALLASQSEELAIALDKERQVTDLQRRFVTMVSHEFRTPLTIVDGNAQILQRRGAIMPAEDILKRATTIRTAVTRLVEMIEKILSAKVLETGKIELAAEPVDITRLLLDICTEQQEIQRKHEIISDIRGLPATVNLDPKLIAQAFTNVLSNAMKYSPENPLIQVRGWADEKSIYISVRDFGIGIPEDEIPQVFSRFFRASTSAGIPGSGIGLNLVKDLIEMHGGKIGLESKLGTGTTVTIELPVKGFAAPKKRKKI